MTPAGRAVAGKPVMLVLEDGIAYGYGSMRENKRGELVFRVKIPCEPEATLTCPGSLGHSIIESRPLSAGLSS